MEMVEHWDRVFLETVEELAEKIAERRKLQAERKAAATPANDNEASAN
jgi:hypothetical protein